MNSTTLPPMPALDLRCREAEWVDRPATITDFNRAAVMPAAHRYASLAEVLVADAIARSHYEITQLAGDRVILSCETPRHGIPLGVQALDRPPTRDWNMREHLTGELLDAGLGGRLERSLATQVRRGLIAVAGALPLLVSPMLAHASPGLGQIEQVMVAPPKLPKDAAPAPAAEPAPPTTEAPPVATPPVVAPPVVTPPAPRIGGDSLTLTGSALWQGLLGKQVALVMKDGASVGGTVVAQSSGDLAIARAADGTVVSVPKAQIVGVRMRVAADESMDGVAGVAVRSSVPVGQRPLQDGRGLAGGGIVMLTFGSVLALSGTVMMAISVSYVAISLPLLIIGLAAAGGGVGMLVAGGKKRKAFNEAWGIPVRAGVQLTPTMSAGRNGGQAGLALRF
jgi:hypothetical protein